MQREYIISSSLAPNYGDVDVDGDYIVIDVSGPFPENGYSYEDLIQGLCQSYVRVTLEKQS